MHCQCVTNVLFNHPYDYLTRKNVLFNHPYMLITLTTKTTTIRGSAVYRETGVSRNHEEPSETPRTSQHYCLRAAWAPICREKPVSLTANVIIFINLANS